MLSFKIRILLFLLILSSSFMAMTSSAKNDQKSFTVVIDAGHGGKDIGATDNGAKEKDINLGVALQLEKLLKKKLKDINVVMTRDNDTYLTLQQRADVANKAKGDLFISIHTNSVDKKNRNRKTVAGSSVYALGLHKDDNNMRVARRENSVIELESNYEQKYSGFDPNRDESYIIFEMAQKKNLSKSIRFAEDVQKELVGIGRKNRGVHQAGFWVLWATSMPSVLIELDFICNPTSAKYMTSSKGEKEFAEGIFNAINKYYESWKNGSSGYIPLNDVVADEQIAESSAEEPETFSSEMQNDGYAAKLNKVEKKKRNDTPAARSSYAAARRRRGDRSRNLSSNRNVETKSIPLHTESERAVSLISLAEEQDKIEVPAQDESQDKDKDKKKKKKAKKEKKAKQKKEKKKRDANAHNAKVEKFVTVYKIQILASADLLRQNNPRFCGLTPISTYKENNLYKYYYGESTDKDEIEKMLKEVQEKIPDAFVVSAIKSNGSAKK